MLRGHGIEHEWDPGLTDRGDDLGREDQSVGLDGQERVEAGVGQRLGKLAPGPRYVLRRLPLAVEIPRGRAQSASAEANKMLSRPFGRPMRRKLLDQTGNRVARVAQPGAERRLHRLAPGRRARSQTAASTARAIAPARLRG